MNRNNSHKELIEHIRELRKRLVISILALAAASIFSYLYVEDIYGFLVKPLVSAASDDSKRMIYTGLTEAFVTYIKLAVFAGVIISFPVIAWQIYAFCAPGLYANEKKFFIPFLVVSPALFFIGAAFVYYFVFPVAWEFFLSFEMPGGEGVLPIQLEAKISEYLSLVTTLIIAFGLTFQLPLVVVLLVKIGLVTVDQLRHFRKYAVVGILTVAAFYNAAGCNLSQISFWRRHFICFMNSLYSFCAVVK
jgi:sec-independent protein translocase protein TatC